jgi:hypothetical protein
MKIEFDNILLNILIVKLKQIHITCNIYIYLYSFVLYYLRNFNKNK